MKLFISAAEASSDAHGAAMLKALKTLAGDEAVHAVGVGGPLLIQEGLSAAVDAREMLSMGLVEALGRLPRLFRALRELERVLEVEKPEVAVLIDYPEFHFRLAKKLEASQVPAIYYIPPKVWVWRKGRIQFLKKFFKKVLSILPFEKEFYDQHRTPLTYVGNPLVDQLPFQLTREEARKQLSISVDQKVLVLLIGSRPAEIREHCSTFLDAALQVAVRLERQGKVHSGEKLRVNLPLPLTANFEEVKRKVQSWRELNLGAPLEIQLTQGDSAIHLRAADVGMIKSGTSTLEAALLGCPHVIVYQPHWLSNWIFKLLVRYRGPVGLSNLVHSGIADRPRVFKEFLTPAGDPVAIADEVFRIFTDSKRHAELLCACDQVKEIVFAPGGSPSLRAAEEVMALVKATRANSPRGGDS